MSTPYITTRQPLSRRHFLRGSGAVALGLPMLEAMTPTWGRSAAQAANEQRPRRFVSACATLGFHTPHLFPKQPGKDYELTPYLDRLREHRNDLTVVSGLSHPEQQGNNGHASEITWLTAARRPGLAGFRNTISIDQLIAGQIGLATRFPSLVLSTSGRSMSWNSSGVEIPGETSPQRLFQLLFVNGSKAEVAEELRSIARGHSVLDTVSGQAKKLSKDLGARDRNKLSEYLTAVRDLEIRLQQSQGWVTRAKPSPDVDAPKDIADRNDAIGRQRLMYDMIVLALQTDSTRTVTFQLSGMNAVPTIPGVTNDWHNLSHHGKDPAKIEELSVIEAAEFAAFNEFLKKLKGHDEQGESLLANTTVLFGSNLGNASSHDWHNLPIILAGGGFRHGQYLAMDPDRNPPFANLFVAIAQQMGLEIDSFGSSEGTDIPGLERA